MKVHYLNRHPEARWRPRWNAGPRDLERLEGRQVQTAWDMWSHLRMDTLEIADALEVSEHQVFNTIRVLRELERNQFGAVPRADSDRANSSAVAPVSVARSLPFQKHGG